MALVIFFQSTDGEYTIACRSLKTAEYLQPLSWAVAPDTSKLAECLWPSRIEARLDGLAVVEPVTDKERAGGAPLRTIDSRKNARAFGFEFAYYRDEFVKETGALAAEITESRDV